MISGPLSRVFVASLAAGTLLGCAPVGPDYVRPAAIVPTHYKEFNGWKVATPRDDSAKGEWWKVFRDAELDRLAAEVAVSNQTLKADEANYREALAMIAQARAGLFPTLNFNPTLTRGTGLPGLASLDAQVTGSWTLDVWGLVRRTIEEKGDAAQVSAAVLANATLSSQSALALAYVQLREADSMHDLYADTVQQYQRSLQIAQNQYDAGTAARSDVITAQAQEIATGVPRAQNEHAIAVLMGRPPAELSIPHAPLAQGIPAIPVGLLACRRERIVVNPPSCSELQSLLDRSRGSSG